MEKYFYDSSLIIEGYKNNPLAVLIYQKLAKINHSAYINIIIWSEVSYILISKKCFSVDELRIRFSKFNFLNSSQLIYELAFDFMQKYNLKPNDAFILATCKFYQIPNLVSLDSHFVEPCKAENINLINS